MHDILSLETSPPTIHHFQPHPPPSATPQKSENLEIMSNDIAARIYVGNINFGSTEDELKEFFQEANPVSVELPSKTIKKQGELIKRLLGFGFVQFETEAAADAAITDFNGKSFKLRLIYAKKALPPSTEEEKLQKTEAFLAKQREWKAKKHAEQAKSKKAAKEKTEAALKAAVAEETSNTPETNEASVVETPAAAPRKPKIPEGPKSKDTVFITNLDYKVTNATLGDLLKEYNPVWVNVPIKRVPKHLLEKFTAKGKPIFNKGIGFAKFADEDTQLKVIEELNGKEVNGRKVIMEVAVERPAPEGKEAKNIKPEATSEAVAEA